MLMVVLLHVSGAGGLLSALPPGSLRWWVLWAGGPVLLRGELLRPAQRLPGRGTSTPSPGWASLAPGGVLLRRSRCCSPFGPRLPPCRDMIAPLFPVLNGTYWYFSAYFALFLLMPFLDSALIALSPASAKRLVFALIAVFSLADFISPEEIFSTRGGYSVAWLAVLYLLGGCLRLHSPARLPRPWLLLAGYACFSLLALVGKTFGVSQPGTFFKWGALLSYTSPLILLAALCLFLALSACPPARSHCRVYPSAPPVLRRVPAPCPSAGVVPPALGPDRLSGPVLHAPVPGRRSGHRPGHLCRGHRRGLCTQPDFPGRWACHQPPPGRPRRR